MLWGIAATALCVLLLCMLATNAGSPVLPLATILSLVGEAVAVAGILLLTKREPQVSDGDSSTALRSVTRVFAALAFAATLLAQLGFLLRWGLLTLGFKETAAVAWIVCGIGHFMYLRRLASRVPDDGLASFTTAVMWGSITSFAARETLGLIIGVLGGWTGAGFGSPGPWPRTSLWMPTCLTMLACVVFGILYIVLLFNYKAAFKEALETGKCEQITQGG